MRWSRRDEVSSVGPNLVLVGAQRSGTTFLKAHLASHPDIAFTPNSALNSPEDIDEAGFPFTSPVLSQASRGVSNERFWYRDLAERTGPYRYLGTKWPYMMVWPHCMTNLRRHVPEASVVVVLRNPIEVTWSAFRLSYGGERENLAKDFGARVERGLADLQNSLTGDHRNKWLTGAMGRSSAAFDLDRNFFAPQVQLICELFPENQRHFIRFNDLVSRPLPAIRGLFKSLGLRSGVALDSNMGSRNSSNEHNPASEGIEMLEETAESLESFFEPSNVRVAELLNWESEWWV